MSDRSDSEPYMQNVQRRTIDIQRSHIAALTAELAATREKLEDAQFWRSEHENATIATLTAQRDDAVAEAETRKASQIETLELLTRAERQRDDIHDYWNKTKSDLLAAEKVCEAVLEHWDRTDESSKLIWGRLGVALAEWRRTKEG